MVFKVAMGEGNQPPDYGEHEPRTHEIERKHQQSPAPLGVY